MLPKSKRIKKPRCYLSAPITGHPIEEVTAQFAAMEQGLTSKGLTTINPLRNQLPYSAPWWMHMVVDIATLLSCRFACFAPLWYTSRGCRMEHRACRIFGIHIVDRYGNIEEVHKRPIWLFVLAITITLIIIKL